MFCGNCGAENENGAKFCKSCGQPLGNGGAAAVQTPVAGGAAAVKKMPQISKKALLGIAGAAVLIVVLVCVAANAGKTIDLNKYLTIEASGYDGYGTATAVIDWDAIQSKYGSKISYNDAAKKEYAGLLNIVSPVEALKDSVRIRFEDNSDLKNGDAVPYQWDIDEEVSQYIKCKLKYKDGSYKVAGLTEVGTFDAFADLTLEYSGISPNGSANMNYTGSDLDYYDFNCDRMYDLSNGDTIKVTIDEGRLQYYAENLGKVPEVLEKEYQVEGLDSYLTQSSQIDDAAMAAMQTQAVDSYTATAAQNFEAGASLESLTYIGNYLLTAKDQSTWGTRNILFLVYRAGIRTQFSNEEGSYDQVNDGYWYIRFDDLLVSADGKLNVDVTRNVIPYNHYEVDSGVSDGWWGTKSWRFFGYPTLEELYKEAVLQNVDNYNHEDSIDESAVAALPAVSEAQETDDGAEETGFIFPNSDRELLSRDDLEGLSAEECKIARNEIYARHGRKFQDEALQAHFDACDWYEGTIDPEDFQETDLTETEIANKDVIVEYEEEKGYR